MFHDSWQLLTHLLTESWLSEQVRPRANYLRRSMSSSFAKLRNINGSNFVWQTAAKEELVAGVEFSLILEVVSAGPPVRLGDSEAFQFKDIV